jgi:phage minor structural protein
METIFLNQSMVVLFVRDDMEQGQWTQEEYSVNATFPYDPNKVIQHGQRIAFRDPATNNLEIFEIRNVNNTEPDHCQQIVAEHIALAELSDEHINTTEITDKTPSQALTTALTGTLWSVGNATATNVSSGDIARGSVWQAILAIMENWNVYITPRVTVSAAGLITGRYLDIAPAQGVWRGVRLSIEKNMLDSSVIYDDTEVYTALYGYGGNVNVAHSGSQDTQEELTFADVVWSATSDHPAKPSGQTYLEDPAKTAMYGRNGRARFGYYQNADIKDANILLEKTWESLKQMSEPKISISGSVIDLYRLGYKDEPLKLHDKVIVEIKETGETFEKTIIRLVVDLLDPTATVPDIGDYIPNIIYINRETASKASGGGGGGGGGSGKTELENEQAKYYWEFVNNGDKIGMVVGTYNGVNKILGGQITLSINADHGSTAKIQADTIDIDGLVTALKAKTIGCAALEVTQGIDCGRLYADQYLYAEGDITCNGTLICDSFNADGTTHSASWKSLTFYRPTSVSPSHYFMYTSSSGGTDPSGTNYGKIITGSSDTTIHYLGY